LAEESKDHEDERYIVVGYLAGGTAAPHTLGRRERRRHAATVLKQDPALLMMRAAGRPGCQLAIGWGRQTSQGDLDDDGPRPLGEPRPLLSERLEQLHVAGRDRTRRGHPAGRRRAVVSNVGAASCGQSPGQAVWAGRGDAHLCAVGADQLGELC